ncbi:MAG: aminotransferase class IV [Thermoanaerobaculum sp.]|nr:aminotransferase class IV [Thermoanaerobaculum sp.]
MVDAVSGTRWAYVNGSFVPFATASLPLEDRGLEFSESLYEVVAVIRGQPFRLADHVARMVWGAEQLGMPDAVPSLATWQSIVTELWSREPHPTAILYAQLTGGTAPREHLPGETPKPNFFAYLRFFSFPSPQMCSQGIAAITLPDNRWYRRDIKTTMLLPAVLAKRQARRQQAAEAIFLGQEGFVHEGASSNVCMVRGGVVASPPPCERLLEGVTLKVVEELCQEIGVPFQRRWVTLSDLKNADEVFITSTTTALMPIVRLDGQPVRGGQPGPISLRLAYHFQRIFFGE